MNFLNFFFFFLVSDEFILSMSDLKMAFKSLVLVATLYKVSRVHYWQLCYPCTKLWWVAWGFLCVFFFSLLWKENTYKLPHVFNFQCQEIATEEMKAFKNKLTAVL